MLHAARLGRPFVERGAPDQPGDAQEDHAARCVADPAKPADRLRHRFGVEWPQERAFPGFDDLRDSRARHEQRHEAEHDPTAREVEHCIGLLLRIHRPGPAGEQDAHSLVRHEKIDEADAGSGGASTQRLPTAAAMLGPERRIRQPPQRISGEAGGDDDQHGPPAALAEIFKRSGQVLGPSGLDDQIADQDVEQPARQEADAGQPLELAFSGDVVGQRPFSEFGHR